MPVSGNEGLQTDVLCLLLHPHTSVTEVSVPEGEAGKFPMALGAGTADKIGLGAFVGICPPVKIPMRISSAKSLFIKICML